MKCFNWLGVTIVLHSFSFSSIKGKNGKHVAIAIWQCVVWLLWKWRNALIFEGIAFSVDKIVKELKSRLWSWFSVKNFVVIAFLITIGLTTLE